MKEDPDEILRMFASMMPSRRISDVIKEQPDFKRKLKLFHPIKSAYLVSGLLTLPSLHANTLRLEMLVHLIIAYSMGNREPKANHIKSWLNTDLGSTSFARLEDPVEDVFVSNVMTDEGNARIFEGVWESSDFYLQRILNIIKTLPEDQSTCQLKREVRAALKLSEEIAVRRRLPRFSPGEGLDKRKIRVPSYNDLRTLCKTVVFTPEDLHRLGISTHDLAPFIFQMHLRSQLGNQTLDDSDLQRHPIVQDAGVWFVLLPNAISVAVRIHVLEWMVNQGYLSSFNRHLVTEYQDFLKETPIFGLSLPDVMGFPLQQTAGKMFLEFGRQIDAGRFLHVIAIIDSISGYLQQGFTSSDFEFIEEYSDQIDLLVKKAQSYFRKQKGFRQGLTLLIGCGYGRPTTFRPIEETPDWFIEFMSAPDFQTLAWTPEASPLFLWKLVNHERYLAKQGIWIANANGLLNLYGWWVDTHYLMLPPKLEFGEKPVHIMIPTDCLVEIRKKVRQGSDLHALPLPNGKFVRVRRKDIDSYFPGEANKPFYVCFDAVRNGELLGAWVGAQSIWWVSAKHDRTGLSRDMMYKIWDAVHNWFERAVPVFERRVKGLTDRTVHVVLDFNNAQQEQGDFVPEHVLRSCLSVSEKREEGTVLISFSDPFFGGFRNPKNVAERTLLRALTMGVLLLTCEAPDEAVLDNIVSEIVLDEDVRYFHMFEAVHFRDYIQHYDHPSSIFIDDADVALTKWGLGWSAQDRKSGNRFTTADESTCFLNRVVDTIWERMRSRLHTLNRVHLIEQALRYIEGVEAERKRWQRTIRAVIALRDDKDSVKGVAIKQVTRCNASEIALRLVVEMAISESPLEGGEPAGVLDLTPLMTDVLFIFNLGGWSDAIRKGVMNPEVEIAPIGDILTHTGFHDEIFDPLGRRFESLRLDYESARYEQHFELPQSIPTVQGIFPDPFLTAFEAEFGLSIDALRGTRDALENYAIEKKRCVFIARRDEILSYCGRSEFTTPEVAKVFLERFSLWPRQAWDKTPKGFKSKDWYPWRFGRSLSLLARPLIRLEDGDNPRYVISPGLIADGTTYTLARYYEADIETSECRSPEMRRWIDDEKIRRSHEFVIEVSNIMTTLGYEVLIEITVNALINEKVDRDYGDVDVLAWNQDEVLAIECKDLKFAKTPNEIAEQLNRFSGQILPNGDRDELLKHLDRCTFLRERSQRVAQMLGIGDRNIHVQTIVCFSMPTPTQYLAKRFPSVTFLTIDELSKIARV